MKINWPLIIAAGIGLLALLIFLIAKNQKDEKSFEEQLNEDYKKSKDQEGDEDTETLPR
jgi:hypothetical protein